MLVCSQVSVIHVCLCLLKEGVYIIAIRDLVLATSPELCYVTLSKPNPHNQAHKHRCNRRAHAVRTTHMTHVRTRRHIRTRRYRLAVPHMQRRKRVSRHGARVARARTRTWGLRAGHHGGAGDAGYDGHQPVEAAGHARHGDVERRAGRGGWGEGRDQGEAVGLT
jgi:hypothetical protein